MKAKLTARSVGALKPAEKPYEVFDTDIKGFLLRVQPTGLMTYYLAYKNRGGQRKRYKIGKAGSVTPIQARDIAEDKAADVTKGIDIYAEKQREHLKTEVAKSRTLRGFLDNKYSPWLKTHRKTGEATLARIEHNFDGLMSRSLEEINSWVVEKWRTEQKKAGKATATVNRDVGALKAALNKAVSWNSLNSNPLINLKPLKIDTKEKVRFLLDDEENRLRDALKGRDEKIKRERASANQWRRERGRQELPNLMGCRYADHLSPMVLLTLNTGLRRGESFSLTWGHVSFHTRTITIEGADAKSGQTRHLPLNDEAVLALQDWKRQGSGEGLVFPGKEGKRLDNIRTSWGGVLEKAKITAFRWHDLRHHFASALVMKGVPLNTVRELLGHSDLTTTLRYAHLAPDHKADAVSLLTREVNK